MDNQTLNLNQPASPEPVAQPTPLRSEAETSSEAPLMRDQVRQSHKSPLVLIFSLFLVLAIAAALFFYYRASSTPAPTPSPTPTSPTPSASAASAQDATANLPPSPPPGSERYTSDTLGISFLYMPAFGGEAFATKQIGNKIFVHPTNLDPESGQYVEIFPKDPANTLVEAINQSILNRYSLTNCITKEVAVGQYPSGYTTARITLLSEGSGAGMEAASVEGEKCPQPYAAYGGLAYFLMDSKHPDKFVFFSIGQYAIQGDNERPWQDTLEFIN